MTRVSLASLPWVRPAVWGLAALCHLCALGGIPGSAAAMPSVDLHGSLDLVETTGDEDRIDANSIGPGENPFHTTHIRLQASALVSPNVEALLDASYEDGSYARLVGGFVRLSDPGGMDLHLEVGKIPLHIGSFPDRATAQKNSLIGVPLMYQYRTDLRTDQVPVRAEDLVANRGLGASADYRSAGLTGLGGYEGHSVPVLYEDYWDFGAVVVGSVEPFEFAMGVTNGTAADPQATDDNDGKQVLARVGVEPRPWIRAGLSASRGPYLYNDLAEVLPAGRHVTDYNQTLAGGDLELSHGHGVLDAEYLWSRFDSPTLGGLDVRSWYAEGKFTVLPGWYVAARYDRMMFGDVHVSSGALESWDADVWRQEIGIGYKPTRNIVAKLVHQETHIATSPARTLPFAALQVSASF